VCVCVCVYVCACACAYLISLVHFVRLHGGEGQAVPEAQPEDG
jgi:hypothetical protein